MSADQSPLELGVAVRLQLTAIRLADLEQFIAELRAALGPQRVVLASPAVVARMHTAVGYVLLPAPGPSAPEEA